MQTKTKVRVTSGHAICMQMLTIAMNATNNGGSENPIVWFNQDIELIKAFPGGPATLDECSERAAEELDHLRYAESLKMRITAYGLWYVGDGTIPVDISAEVRIFRNHKEFAWQPHYCVFLQPSLGNGDQAHGYIFTDFAYPNGREAFLGCRHFPGSRNWSVNTQLITDGRRENFLKLAKPLFVKTGEESNTD